MRRNIYSTLLLGALALGSTAQAQVNPSLESLDRGVTVVRTTSNFVTWRMLATDNEDLTTFDILRSDKGDEPIAKDLYKTNYQDWGGKADSEYRIVTKVDGEAVDTTAAALPFVKYKQLKLDLPAAGSDYSYTPNDCSVGDVDGDGQYELFVKWDPSNSHDNSQNGKTGNVFIDCYRLDGTKLWRIDLGVNIRAGAHYTQYMVYDFNGDGKAEMICKTGPGSIDGQGQYVTAAATDAAIDNSDTNNKKDYRNSNGRITGGQEYLTVFDGMTGRAIHTVFYYPNRGMTYGGIGNADVDWSGSGKDKAAYGNRGERYLAAVAHIDGLDKPAAGIFCRGYYTYAFIWAVTFDGTKLTPRWLNESKSATTYSLLTWNEEGKRKSTSFLSSEVPGATKGSGSKTMYGNGNHNLTIGDVDGDGCDEIVWGSACCDNDGKVLYATGHGHGDAIHMGRMIPDREGFQVFQIHEESPFGWDLHDAATGEILRSATGSEDNGRGMACDFVTTHRGWEYWSAKGDRRPTAADNGDVVYEKNPSMNFRIYWDGDLYDELLDGGNGSHPVITKYGASGIQTLRDFGDTDGNPQSCNSTKSTPCLQADIIGDWREELLMRSADDPSLLNIYVTNTGTEYRMPTLMHDHNYRMAIAWQNVAYNQPPHVSTYLPDAMKPEAIVPLMRTAVGEATEFKGALRRCKTATMKVEGPDGKSSTDFTFKADGRKMTISGTPTQTGSYILSFTLTGLGNEKLTQMEEITVTSTSAIYDIAAPATTDKPAYNLNGQRISANHRGIVVIDGQKTIRK